MNTLQNTFTNEASIIRSSLEQFDDAGELKNAISDIYPRIKKLLHKAHPVLNIDMSQLPSNSGSKLRLNIHQTEIKGNELLFTKAPLYGYNTHNERSVSKTLHTVLDKIEGASVRYDEPHFSGYD